jgi:ADP-L-glycero-D-manno-heptose 6-epimerase
MIIVTGAAGFIGSQIALHLDQSGESLILVDKKKAFDQTGYVKGLKKARVIDAESFLGQLDKLTGVSWIIHMGAITNTGETNLAELKTWNVDYTKAIWSYCAKNKIDLIYASSAATYGGGEAGFADDHKNVGKLKPLNPYGRSKQEFDVFALSQVQTPPHWYGLKYFNVYGPNEDHKARMASAVWHGYNEIKRTGQMTLFKSHNPLVKDGDQARDFIFVGDVLQIIDFVLSETPANGIYNVGTGEAGTFLQLAENLFAALGKPMKINWVETPPQFRAAYQYRTQAEINKLRSAGYMELMTTLSTGIKNYIRYLETK